ncbi:hypothetical protein JZU57_01450, partial [bacterium]|nr:hypothetical protein [bacterium]
SGRRTADDAILAIEVGPFTCVFPTIVAAEVLGGFRRERLSPRRGAAAIPVIDTAALLGPPQSDPPPSHAVVLRRPGRRDLILLAPHAVMAKEAPPWRGLPVLPRTAHGLFGAVRLNGRRCDFLLRENSAIGRNVPQLAGLSPHALVGWLNRSS